MYRSRFHNPEFAPLEVNWRRCKSLRRASCLLACLPLNGSAAPKASLLRVVFLVFATTALRFRVPLPPLAWVFPLAARSSEIEFHHIHGVHRTARPKPGCALGACSGDRCGTSSCCCDCFFFCGRSKLVSRHSCCFCYSSFQALEPATKKSGYVAVLQSGICFVRFLCVSMRFVLFCRSSSRPLRRP